jgi:hypothetical protein
MYVPSKSKKPKKLVDVLKVTDENSRIRIRVSGSMSQRYKSAYPDLYQNFMDPQHCSLHDPCPYHLMIICTCSHPGGEPTGGPRAGGLAGRAGRAAAGVPGRTQAGGAGAGRQHQGTPGQNGEEGYHPEASQQAPGRDPLLASFQNFCFYCFI